MLIKDVDVSQCDHLKVKNLTLNWGIGKEYTKEYRCKKHNDLSCELFDECEYKRCKRLNKLDERKQINRKFYKGANQ